MKTRPYAVEVHKDSKKIIRELAEGVQISSISKRYGIHRNALTAFKRNRMPEQVVKAVERRDITAAEEIYTIILKTVRDMEKLADSCDDFLQDPEDSEKYYMGPRAHEIDVVWEELVGQTQDGMPRYKKHKETLQDVIDRHFSRQDNIISVKASMTDPRVLFVRSADTLTKQMDTLVQAWKAVDQGRSSFLGTPAWQEVVKTILEATEEYPDIRRVIADRLSRISEEGDRY